MPYRDEQIGANLIVPAGATVYDVSGQKLGKVAGGIAQREYFYLERGLLFHHDYYVPKRVL
jgi:hypothetical protein